MIDVLIPTFKRADRLHKVYRNVIDNTAEPVRVWFIVEGLDRESLKAVPHGARCFVNRRKANYAGAINTACINLAKDSDAVFLGADDLDFHGGWDTEALKLLKAPTKVVGTNDLGNPYVLQGLHSTHSLVKMDYVTTMGGVWDEPTGIALPEIYDHNYTDTEFVGTATARGVFKPGLDAVVEHLHYAFGKAEVDPTYERGNRESDADRVVYLQRKKTMWGANGMMDSYL